MLKGEAELRFLCFDGEGQCRAGTAVLPFSQYIDLGDCEDQDELQLWSCLTGLDAEPSVDGTGVNVTIQILTAAKVWGRREIPYTADLYSTMEILHWNGRTAAMNPCWTGSILRPPAAAMSPGIFSS